MKKYLVILILLISSCQIEEKITLKPYSNQLIGTSWAKLLGYDTKTGKGYYEIFVFSSETEVYLVRADAKKNYNGPIVSCAFKRTGNIISITGTNVSRFGYFKDYVLVLDNNEYELITE
ncbi:hypothetical protein [Dyadobacter sp. NIV53]|uniref:hypothetical protein n=1 Tax=Dyadobacter sp. NIV53 TaxID=2861765 RepID=UPI001C86CE28|nr:hypothetical protein [Dyadobacter sp. NIV53]